MTDGTTIRAVRVEDELWTLADQVCQRRGVDRAAVMRAALAAYVELHGENPETSTQLLAKRCRRWREAQPLQRTWVAVLGFWDRHHGDYPGIT
jgi:CHAD domain-containing protein